MVGCFLKIWLNVIIIPFSIFHKYILSRNVIGLRSNIFDLFVNACIFLFFALAFKDSQNYFYKLLIPTLSHSSTSLASHTCTESIQFSFFSIYQNMKQYLSNYYNKCNTDKSHNQKRSPIFINHFILT